MIYRLNQIKHIDPENLMDLIDPNSVNSSSFMINAACNAVALKHDEDTD